MQKQIFPILITAFYLMIVGLAPGLLPSANVNASEETVMIEDAVIPQPPPGAMAAAGYMRVTNNGSENVALTGASGENFDRIEIHRSVIENGVAKMIKQESVVVPAGETLEFAHGGYHLMLMGAKSALDVGMEVVLTLITEEDSINVSFSVKSAH